MIRGAFSIQLFMAHHSVNRAGVEAVDDIEMGLALNHEAIKSTDWRAVAKSEPR
jgi:hypothetical protein